MKWALTANNKGEPRFIITDESTSINKSFPWDWSSAVNFVKGVNFEFSFIIGFI
jgi:hypothetical protein